MIYISGQGMLSPLSGCDNIYENQPFSKKINYRVSVEVVVQARRS